MGSATSGKRPGEVPADVLKQAAMLLANGTSWSSIERTLGVSTDRLRRQLDPTWADRRRNRVRQVRHGRIGIGAYLHDYVLSPADAARALASVPRDTRTFTARVLGDPLPGRSALDRLNRSLGRVNEPLRDGALD